jgi:tetratricopeptide (TPR) repeat protein
LAEDLTRKALTILREFGDKTEIAWGLCDLSRVIREPEEAKRLAEESIALFIELDHKVGQAIAHLFRATVSGDLSREGENYLLECLTLSRENGFTALLAWALSYLTYYYSDRGQGVEAQQARQESLTLFRELNHRRGLALMLTETAADAMDRGDLEAATRLMNESLAINREIGEPSYLGWALTRSGILADIKGDDAEAHRLAQDAFALTEGTYGMNTYDKFLVEQFLAWTYCVRGEFTSAARHLASCLQGMVKRREMAHLIYSLPAAMWVLAARGQPVQAVELLGLAVHTRAGEIQRWDVRPHWKSLLADLEAELGSEVYQAAFERGKGLNLETVVTDLIAELAAAGGV